MTINQLLKKSALLRQIVFIIYPDFLCKISIKNSIIHLLNKHKKHFYKKRILDIGCGSKPYAKLFESLSCSYQGIDFEQYTNFLLEESNSPDYKFDKEYSRDFLLTNFRDKSYDAVVAFEVLEHHEQPETFFKEVSRILNKNGLLLITFPFIWNLHEEPFDYQRLTHHKVKKLGEQNGFTIIELIKRGSPLETVIQVTNLAILNINIFPIKIFLLMFSIPMQIFAYPFNMNRDNSQYNLFLGYTILLKKTN